MNLFWLLALVNTCFGTILTNESFATFLLEYTTILDQKDVIIDARCPLGGLYREDRMCVRTFSPGCLGNVGLVIGGRCRRRTAPIWNGTSTVNVCANVGGYLDLNATRAAKRQKGFVCIGVGPTMTPSPNLMNYGANQKGQKEDPAIIGGGIGGGFAGLVILAVLGAGFMRKRVTKPPPQSFVLQQTNPLHAPKKIPTLSRVTVQQLEYARSDFKPMRARPKRV
jgi:hypothetical protein